MYQNLLNNKYSKNLAVAWINDEQLTSTGYFINTVNIYSNQASKPFGYKVKQTFTAVKLVKDILK